MEAVTGAFVWKWFRCVFLLRHLFQDAFVWFQLFFLLHCSPFHMAVCSLDTVPCLLYVVHLVLAWWGSFKLSGRDIHCLWGHPIVNCGSDKTGLGHFCYKAPLGKAQRHQMARQSVSIAVLGGARWTHCKKIASVANDFMFLLRFI